MIQASDHSLVPVSASSSAASWPTATAARSPSSGARSARAARSSFAFPLLPACMPPPFCPCRRPWKAALPSAEFPPRLRGRVRLGAAALPGFGWRCGEERDRLLDLCAAALRAGMFLLTLCVAAHHFKDIAAFRALELINRHDAHPPGTSHRPVAYKTTLFPSPARGGRVRVGAVIPLPLWRRAGWGLAPARAPARRGYRQRSVALLQLRLLGGWLSDRRCLRRPAPQARSSLRAIRVVRLARSAPSPLRGGRPMRRARRLNPRRGLARP